MNNATTFSYDDTIQARFSARNTTAVPAVVPIPAPVQPMPESLWRHTLQEHSADRRHRIVCRIFFAVTSALGAGSVAYAVWQTCVLMAGNDLPQAIGLLMR